MRVFVAAILSVITFSSSFAAVAPAKSKPCNTSCLTSQVIDLQGQVVALQDEVLTLQGLVSALQGEVKDLQKATNPATTAFATQANLNTVKMTAATVIKDGAKVVLCSNYSALTKCLWQSDFDRVNAVDADPGKWWQLKVVPGSDAQ